MSSNLELLEQHFNHPVPAALKKLYRDEAELLRTEFLVVVTRGEEQFALPVDEYFAIDEETFNFCEGFEQYIVFANDDGECLYLIDPTQDNPEVQFFDFEACELHPTGCTLSEFLAAPRLSQEDDGDSYAGLPHLIYG